MATNDPSPNGKKPTLDGLEEVDPADISIEDEPSTVEVVQKKSGFGFWMALVWCIVFLIVTQVIPVIGLVFCLAIYLMSTGTTIDAEGLASSPLMKQTLQIAIPVIELISIGFGLLVLRLRVGREWTRKIGLRLPSTEHTLIVIAALPALLLVGSALYEVITRFVPGFSRFGIQGIEEFMKETQSWPWWLAVLTIGFGPAIGEELWCRGFLGQGLAGRYSTWGAALLASFFFGLIHIDPPHALWAMLMGIALHFSYLMTRSILTPMLIHLFNNSMAILMLSDNANVPVAKSLETAFEFRPWLMLATAIFVLIAAGVALYHSRVRLWTLDGEEAVKAPYPHVEYPPEGSRYDVHAGPVSPLHMLALIVSVAAFAAAWFGL